MSKNIKKSTSNNTNRTPHSKKRRQTQKLQLWQKVLIGMLLGGLLGYLLSEHSFLRHYDFFNNHPILRDSNSLVKEVLDPIGKTFINLLRMVVVPLIFFAILYGITSIDDIDTFSRLGSRALIIYCTTTIFAISSGLVMANIFEPGIGMEGITFPAANAHDNAMVSSMQNKTIKDIIMDIIPPNPIRAMAEGHTLQVVVFSFFTGIALILIGNRGNVVCEFIVSATSLVFKMVELVIKLTPYGVFALMATTVATYGLDILFGLMKFVLVVLGALAFHYCVLGMIMLVIGRINPIPFYKKMKVTQALAFATSSTKASLPTAMMELRKKMGVSKRSSSFILPLGAAMNMDATAIYLGICSVFFAQITGVTLSMSQYFVIILTATIGSIGAAGFPGGGIVMMGMVLSSVGLPIEGIPLILGVDRFLEMVRTTLNITGDCAVTVIVDKMEGTLDKKVYCSAEHKSPDIVKD